MPGAIGGGLPRMTAVVVHFKDHGVGIIAQPQPPAGIVQRSGAGP